MPIIDLSKILSKHKEGWLALSPKDKKLIAKEKTLKEVLRKSKRKGVENPIIFKVAPVKNLLIG